MADMVSNAHESDACTHAVASPPWHNIILLLHSVRSTLRTPSHLLHLNLRLNNLPPLPLHLPLTLLNALLHALDLDFNIPQAAVHAHLRIFVRLLQQHRPDHLVDCVVLLEGGEFLLHA